MSRQKGARGEREVRDILVAGGFKARRDGRLDDDLDHSVDGYHFEVKRRERYEIDAWLEQAAADAGERMPIVAFRKSGQPWRGIIDLERLVRLLGLEADAWQFLEEFTNHPGEGSDDQEIRNAGGTVPPDHRKGSGEELGSRP